MVEIFEPNIFKMNRSEKKEHTDLFSKAVKKLRKLGYRDIRADILENFDDPQSFTRRNNEEPFTPDITATSKSGKRHYFDIALKTDNERRLVTKWRLLDTMADLKNRKFKLLIPYGSQRFTNDIVDNYNISPQMIKI